YVLKDRLVRLGPAIERALAEAKLRRERKRAEEQIRFHEAVLRETGQIAKVGGWYFDPGTGVGYWTEEVARIHDLPAGTPITLAAGLEFYTPEARPKITAAIKAAVEEAKPYDLELEIETAAGRRKWIRTIGHPVMEQGRVVRVRGSFQDITERKQADQSLRESEERFRQVVENIHEVFWMTDVEKNQMIYISPGYEGIWGRKCESLYASPRTWLESIHESDQARVIQAATTKQMSGTYDETYRIRRPDGEIRWIRDRAFPVRDGRGIVQRIVGVAADITEQKKLEAQFLHAQRIEAIGTLASGIAHDLNNILAPVLMAAGVLQGKLADPQDRSLTTMIQGAAERGAAIVRQLLTFSRGAEGDRTNVNLGTLINEISHIVRETFPRSITVKCDVPSDLWHIKADATQLYQVLLNFCVNSRDAMPAGGGLTLAAENILRPEEHPSFPEAARSGRHVLLTVSDTGLGIPPEIVDRIFDPFFTTKDPDKGTGLGLSTALGIIRSHGGFISVQSEVGQGTTFSVFLPAEAETAADSGRAPAPFVSGQNELVLLVDDEEAIRDTISSVLRLNNYCVRSAANGEEALRLFAELHSEVRVVLTDMMMPTMGGEALLRALHRIDPDIKCIAMSGYNDLAGNATLSEFNAAAFLHKPFEAIQLLEVVRQVLAEDHTASPPVEPHTNLG
ncbi:MAG: PAS domain-containing protein, partial [Opitutales bacterium]